MDLTSLDLKAEIRSEKGAFPLDVLGGDEDRLILGPIDFAQPEEKLEVLLHFPKDYEMDHLAADFLIPARVERSESVVLVLAIGDSFPPEVRQRWSRILGHLRERVGQMARAHPRLVVPGFGFGLEFTGDPSGLGKIFDVSLGGARVLSELDARVGQVLRFRLRVPEALDWAAFARNVEGSGTVRRVLPRGFGLEFLPEEVLQQTIRKLVGALTRMRARELRYPRYNVHPHDLKASVRVGGTQGEISCRVKDVSQSGVYLLATEVPPLDAEVRVDFRPAQPYEALRGGLSLSGRVVRETPDGFCVRFGEAVPERERLADWLRELAAEFSGAPPARGERPKVTLSIHYGNDLLLLREYLFNMSSGGCFLPGVPALEKGDLVNFHLDLSGTSVAQSVAEPLAFLGRVVRTAESGVGIQFLEPDGVRQQLEGMLTDLLKRKSFEEMSEESELRRAESAARSALERADSATDILPFPSGARPRFRPINVFTAAVAAGALAGGAIWLRWRTRRPPVEVPLAEFAAAPAAGTAAAGPRSATGAEESEETAAPEFLISTNHRLRKVRTAEIADVVEDEKSGPKIVLRNGETFPAEGLEAHLPAELRARLAEMRDRRFAREARDLRPPAGTDYAPRPTGRTPRQTGGK